jgi:hypothetical protein
VVERQLDNGSWIVAEQKHAGRITLRDGTSVTAGPGLRLFAYPADVARAIAGGRNQ